jgi:Resolvase, N terminal domain
VLIGYARVSTEDQDLTLQRSALKSVGCEWIDEEKVTGARQTRPQLARILDQLRAIGRCTHNLRAGRGKAPPPGAGPSKRPRQRLNVFSVASSKPNAIRP